MITQRHSHPDLERLANFLRGALQTDEMDSVADHVSDCSMCCDRLGELTTSQNDSFLVRLREAGRPPAASSDGDSDSDAPRPCDLPTDSPPGYEILKEIGRGGMGAVYQARDQRLKRLVALKVILAGSHSTPKQRAQFQTEAETVASLNHEHIVQIHEVGEYEGRPHLVMELVEGGNLHHHTQRQPQSAKWSAAIVQRLALAVQYAHEEGVVHRDLKPDNVLLKPGDHPKITDFGLAKQLDSHEANTRSNAILGTPSYMAPEQTTGGTSDVGVHADVYALGAILYELLTGGPPFQSDNSWETMRMVREDDPIPPTRLQPKLPRDLETICLRCLEKSPRRRYHSAGELADDLGRFLRTEPVQARRIGLAGRVWRWMRRSPMAAALLALVALIFFTGLPLTTGLAIWAFRERDKARYQESLARQASQGAEVSKAKAQAAAFQAQRALASQISAESVRAMREGDFREAFNGTASSIRIGEEAGEDGSELRSSAALKVRCEQLIHRSPSIVSRRQGNPVGPHRLTFSEDSRELTAVEPLGDWREQWTIDAESETGPAMSEGLDFRPLRFGDHGRWQLGTAGKQVVLRHVSTGWPVVLEIPQGLRKSLADDTKFRKLAVSQDNRWAVLLPRLIKRENPQEVYLWDLRTGALRLRRNFQVSYVHNAWFTPSGDWAVFQVSLSSASESYVALLVNLHTGKTLEPKFPLLRPAEDGAIGSLAVSRDGRLLAAAREDGVQIWALDPTGKEPPRERKRIAIGASKGVVRLEFDAEAGRLLVAAKDGVARVWDLEAGTAIGVPIRHRSPISVARFSPDQARVLTASNDGKLRVWRAKSGQPLTPFMHHDSGIVAAVWSGRGDLVAATERSGLTTVWDLKTSLADGRLLMHEKASVNVVRFASDSRRLLSGSEDGAVRIWDCRTGQLESTLHNEFPVRDAYWDAPGEQIAVFVSDWDEWAIGTRAAQVWNVASGGPHTKSIGRTLYNRGPRTIRFSSNGRYMVLAVRPFFNIFDVVRKQDIYHWRNGRPHHLIFSPDGERVAIAGSRDDHNFVSVIVASTGELLHEAKMPSEVSRLHLSEDGRYLAALGEFGARVWDLQSDTEPSPLCFSHEQRPVIWGDFRQTSEGTVFLTVSDTLLSQVWNLETQRTAGKSFRLSGLPALVEFHGTAPYVVTVTHSGSASVWDWRSGEPVSPVLRHGAKVNSACISPDGRFLAVAGIDGAVKIWELPGTEAQPVDALFDRSASVAFASASSNDFFRATSTSAETLAWHERQAQDATREGHWQAAAHHQALALQLEDSLPLRRAYADSLSHLARWAEARDQLSRVLQAEDSRPDDWIARGRARVALEQWDAALNDFEQASNRAPADGACFMWQSFVHLQEGRLEAADGAYLAAANRTWRGRATVVRGTRKMGLEAATDRRRWTPLLEAFTKATDDASWSGRELDANHWGAFLRGRGLARAIVEHWKLSHFRRRNFKRDTWQRLFQPTLDDFLAAEKLRPEDGTIQFALGLLAFNGQEWKKAELHFRKAIEQKPGQRDLLTMAVSSKVAARRPLPEMLKAANRAIADGEDCADVRFLRAQVWFVTKKWSAAEADLDRAIALDPMNTPSIRLRGQLKASKQSWAEAHDDFQRVIRVAPQDMQVLRALVVAGHASDRQDEALATSRRLLERIGATQYENRERKMELNELIWAACVQPNFPPEELTPHFERFQKVVKNSPNKPGYKRTLAAMLLRMGRVSEALPKLQMHAEKPQDLAAAIFLAMAKHRLGQEEEARGDLASIQERFADAKRSPRASLPRSEVKMLLRELESFSTRPTAE